MVVIVLDRNIWIKLITNTHVSNLMIINENELKAKNMIW